MGGILFLTMGITVFGGIPLGMLINAIWSALEKDKEESKAKKPPIIIGTTIAVFIVSFVLLSSSWPKLIATETEKAETYSYTPAPISTPAPTIKPSTPKNYYVMQSTPQSSCFSEVGYNAATQTLKVCFRESGIYYLYHGFSQSDYDSFISADSLGTYFNQNIKGYYSYTKLDDEYYREMEEDEAYGDWIADLADGADDIPEGYDRIEWVQEHIDDYIDYDYYEDYDDYYDY